MEEKTVTNAILKINPNAEVTVKNIYDLDNCEIEWLNGTTPISIEDIKVEFDKLWLILVLIVEQQQKQIVSVLMITVRAVVLSGSSRY